MRQIMEIMDSHIYAVASKSIAVERLIVASHGGQTNEDKVKAAVAPVKTALEAIESLTDTRICSVTN
ncbi:hypothetical protein NDA07_12700 [Microcoleus vaginatus DQ-U2]|uniref:hypothetical protein n=1 Tax=Microcoleus vaginatus TaxID=119532 RepID=UPI0032A853E2